MTTYYSRAANLIFYAGKPQKVIQDGIVTTIEPPPIRFSPFSKDGSGTFDGFGILTTDDPDIIKAVEARRAEQLAAGMGVDVLSAQEYLDEVTPPQIKMISMQEKIDALQRELTARNELLAHLEASKGKPQSATR